MLSKPFIVGKSADHALRGDLLKRAKSSDELKMLPLTRHSRLWWGCRGFQSAQVDLTKGEVPTFPGNGGFCGA